MVRGGAADGSVLVGNLRERLERALDGRRSDGGPVVAIGDEGGGGRSDDGGRVRRFALGANGGGIEGGAERENPRPAKNSYALIVKR